MGPLSNARIVLSTPDSPVAAGQDDGIPVGHGSTVVAMSVTYEWRGAFGNQEVEALHAEGFDHEPIEYDWIGQLGRHSLGWICARKAGKLVGFVNVAWDGAAHAFVLDTLTEASARHQGIGTRMVELATEQARAAGCEWLHVDFDDDLARFYLDSCGFPPVRAGVVRL